MKSFVLCLIFFSIAFVSAEQVQIKGYEIRYLGGEAITGDKVLANEHLVISAEFVNSGESVQIEAHTGLELAKWYVDGAKVAEGKDLSFDLKPGISRLEVKGFTPQTIYDRKVVLLCIYEPELKVERTVTQNIISIASANQLIIFFSASALLLGLAIGFISGRKMYRKSMLILLRKLTEELKVAGFSDGARELIRKLINL